LVKRGSFTKPAIDFPGAVYQGEATSEEAWQEIKHFWDGWGEEDPE
jgi:predicted RNase H-like HicB family nuclease